MKSVALHSSPEWQFIGNERDIFGFHPESGNRSLLPGTVLSVFKIRDLHRMNDLSAACRDRFEACAAGCSKKFDCLQDLQEATGIRDELVTDLSISADSEILHLAAKAAALF